MTDVVEQAIQQAQQAAAAAAPAVPPQAAPAVPPQAAPAVPPQAAPAVPPQAAPVEVAPVSASLPAAAPASYNAVAASSVGGSMSFAQAAASAAASMNDYFIKLTAYGVSVKFQDGDPKAHLAGHLIKELDVKIDFSEIQFCRGVVVSRQGADAEYYRSYDGVTATTGEPWAAIIQKAKTVNPASKGDYSTCDLIMEVTKEIRTPENEVVLSVGDTLGYSPSVTNFTTLLKAVQSAIKSGWLQVDQQGKLEGVVNAHLTIEGRKKGSSHWGVLHYTFSPAA